MFEQCAQALADSKALGWFQGRIEFGPRALGARSILGDARSPSMQSVLNLKVKYRESFPPFAPAVLREDVQDCFELDDDSLYMLLVADVVHNRRPQMTAEAQRLFGHCQAQRAALGNSSGHACGLFCAHPDGASRYQPRFHLLLSEFKRRTGCPVVVNTSFNVRGEPIVCTPEDAFRCFMGTEIEYLAVGNRLLSKEGQDQALRGEFTPRSSSTDPVKVVSRFSARVARGTFDLKSKDLKVTRPESHAR